MKRIQLVSNKDFVDAMVGMLAHAIDKPITDMPMNAIYHRNDSIPASSMAEQEKMLISQRIRLMGIDHSPNNTGISLSDQLLQVAHPYRTIRKEYIRDTISIGSDVKEIRARQFQAYQHVIDQVNAVINENNVKGIVVGYPLDLDGSTGIACKRVERFVSQLMKSFALEKDREAPSAQPQTVNAYLTLWDERLSTQTVRHMIPKKHQKKNKAKSQKHQLNIQHDEDARAAAFILQGALDMINDSI